MACDVFRRTSKLEFLDPTPAAIVNELKADYDPFLGSQKKTDRDREHTALNSTEHEHEARTRIPQPDHGDSEG